MAITIPAKAFAEIVAHAREEEPYECCGVMIGNMSAVKRVHRARNVNDERTRRFTIEPLDLLEAERTAGERSEEIVGFYHSHPRTGAYPSKTDIDNVVDTEWWEPVWLIVSLAASSKPVVKAFRISLDRTVEEILIETTVDADVTGYE